MKSTLFLLLVTFSLIGCNEKQSSTIEDIEKEQTLNPREELNKINEYLKQFEEPSQIFNVSSEKPSKVEGKLGTIISINPDDLIEIDGNEIGQNIEIELKELTNQEQLLRSNAQTISNGKLLVSGGAYFINMTSSGKQLKLKENKTFTVEFPKISNEKMTLFYGQRDSLGQMNWIDAQQNFENRPVPTKMEEPTIDEFDDGIDAMIEYIKEDSKRVLTKEEKKALEEYEKQKIAAEKLYKAIELNQFGWINCDRFIENENKTNLYYTFNSKDSIVSANIFLVFNDINSVMKETYFSFNDKKFHSNFLNIPIGSNTQLIAISVKNDKTYTYKADFVIKDNEKVELVMKESTQEGVENLFVLKK